MRETWARLTAWLVRPRSKRHTVFFLIAALVGSGLATAVIGVVIWANDPDDLVAPVASGVVVTLIMFAPVCSIYFEIDRSARRRPIERSAPAEGP